MPTDVERLAVLIEANTKSYERAMKRVISRTEGATRRSARSLGRLEKATSRAGAAAQAFATRFLAGFGIGAGVAGILGAADAVQNMTAEMSKLVDVADKVGVTVEQLQELRFAGEQNSVAFNTTDMALQRFSRRIAEAANGSGELLPILKANNLELRDSDGNLRPLIDILKDYADLVRNAGSNSEQLLLSFKAFDSEGAAYVNVLRDGAAGLDEMAEKARETSRVFDDDFARRIKQIDQEFSDFATNISTHIKGGILDLVSALAQLREQVHDLAGSGIDQQIARFKNELNAALEAPVGSLQRRSAPRYLKLIEDLQSKKFAVSNPSDDGSGETTDPRVFGSLVPVPRLRPPRTIIPDGGVRSSAISNLERQRAAADKLIATLEHELNLIGLSAVEQEVMNNLRQAGAGATEQQRGAIASLTRELEAARVAEQAMAEIMDLFAQTATSAISGLINGTESLSDSLRRLVDQLAAAALQAALLGNGPLAGLFGGGGGLLPALFGGGSPFNLLAGARAQGGPVSAGRGYLVGERGPEIFVPRMPGKVLANGAGGGVIDVRVSAGPEFDVAVARSAGPVAVRVAGNMIGETERRRQRAQATGAI